MGRFVAIEGPDGSGKTTQARRLAQLLGATYITAPSSGEIGKAIRRVLSCEVPFPGADALQLLFLADRAEVSEKLLRPALARGDTIVADRWSLSGFVYGSVDAAEASVDVDAWRAWYAASDARTLQPDTYIVLAASPRCALARVGARGRATERYEQAERIERVCASYERLCGSSYLGSRLLGVPADGDPDQVASLVLDGLLTRQSGSGDDVG